MPALPQVRYAWSLAWRRAVVQFFEHMPLLAGVIGTALLHGIRAWVLPDGNHSGWVKLIDMALLMATFTMGCSLVLGPGLRLVIELAEVTFVGKNRLSHTWRTGRRLPTTTWAPADDEADDDDGHATP